MGKIENLIKFEASVDNDTQHNKVCKELVRFAENNQITIPLLLYIGVATNGHKEEIFNKGYKSFNTEKATSVLTMADIFSKYFNYPNARTNDKVIHCCSRFYSFYGGSITQFQKIIKTKDKTNFKMSNFKNAKELGEFLFSDKLEFTDKGYIVQKVVKKR